MMELFHKEMVNSLYGRIGQSVNPRNSFDVKTGLSKELSYSLITCAYLASYISGLVRATVSELIAAIPDKYHVYSVTTDGFLTDAPENKLNLTGVAISHYTDLLHKVDAHALPIACKHQVNQIIIPKTRGTFTLASDRGSIITAKCGVKADCAKADENDWMIDLYLNRKPLQYIKHPLLISTREMFLKREDLIRIERTVRLNLEPDLKRELISPTEVAYDFKGMAGRHIYLQSKPWDNADDFITSRVCFDSWVKGRYCKKNSTYIDAHCLKNVTDFNHYKDYEIVFNYLNQLKMNGVTGFELHGGKTSDNLLLRVFIIAFVNNKPAMTYAQAVSLLKAAGYDVNEGSFKNVKMTLKGFPPVPKTEVNKCLSDLIEEKFPLIAEEIL